MSQFSENNHDDMEALGGKFFEHLLFNPMQYPGSTIDSMAQTAMAEEQKALANNDYASAAFQRGFLKRCD